MIYCAGDVSSSPGSGIQSHSIVYWILYIDILNCVKCYMNGCKLRMPISISSIVLFICLFCILFSLWQKVVGDESNAAEAQNQQRSSQKEYKKIIDTKNCCQMRWYSYILCWISESKIVFLHRRLYHFSTFEIFLLSNTFFWLSSKMKK